MSVQTAKPFRHPSIAEIAALDEQQRQALIFSGAVIEGERYMYQLNPYEAAKKWGKAHGYTGELGGWIWRHDRTDRPVCQGWMNLWKRANGPIRRWYADRAAAVAGSGGREGRT